MRILLGITGGIAAYKAANLIRLFRERGHQVTVVPTENALRFIGAPTLEALSGEQIDIDMYHDVSKVRHVSLGQNADLIVVAPATAAFLARLSHGLADDLLLNAILASTAEVVVVPAMHTEMWLNAATVQNVKTLQNRGVRVMQPAVGKLTGDDSGPGRMPEPDDIVNFALSKSGPLAGRKVLITLGGTREPIDPVRFIGNRSSGKQGIALAVAASELGADVSVIAANVEVDLAGVTVTSVETVAELAAALLTQEADLMLMAAAVSDYTAETSQTKLRRGELDTLKLNPTKDLIAAWSLAHPNCFNVAFALEDTEDLESAALAKLRAKGVQAVIANRPVALGSEHTELLLVTESESVAVNGTKAEVARELVAKLAAKLSEREARL